MPEISVIVPVYNVERYLTRCIDSILAQTYQNFELILVDDGSTDGSGTLCDSYMKKDSRIKVIHKKNGGLSDARNSGIDAAEGEFLSFIDSDDWVRPDFLNILHGNAVQYGADVSVVNLHKEYDDGRIEKLNRVSEELLSREEALQNLYRIGIYINVACNKLYKSALFSDIRYPVGKLHEDGFTTYKLLYKANRVYYSDADLYCYYQRSGSIMNQPFTERRLDEYEVYKERAEFFQREHLTKLLGQNERTKNACIRTLTVKIMESEWPRKQKKKYLTFFQREVKATLPYLKKEDALAASIYCASPMLFYWMHKLKSHLKRERRLVRESRIMLRFVSDCLWARILHKNHVAFLMMTPVGGNLGDHAIAIAEEELLSDLYFVEMPCPYFEIYWKHKNIVQKLVQNSTILLNGGGYLGTLWYDAAEQFTRKVIETFQNNPIIILPNTCYYEDSDWGREQFEQSKAVYNSHHALYIFAREEISYEFMKGQYKNVYLMPDLVMSLRWNAEVSERSGALVCLREDCERTVSEAEKKMLLEQMERHFKRVVITDTVVPRQIGRKERKTRVYEKLKEFSRAKLVLTDRLHGMVFAAITGTPCIVIHSKSHKLEGCFRWIKNLEYIRFIENMDEISSVIGQIVGREYFYDNSDLSGYYEKLKRFVYSIHGGARDGCQKEEHCDR